MKTITKLVDKAIDALYSFQDYFYITKTVTLSEWTLLTLGATHATWLYLFDLSASAPFYQYVYSEILWSGAFTIAVAIHCAGLIKESWPLRFLAARIYAALWFVWFWAVGAHNLHNPVAPRIALFCVLSVIVSVKLGVVSKRLKSTRQKTLTKEEFDAHLTGDD